MPKRPRPMAATTTTTTTTTITTTTMMMMITTVLMRRRNSSRLSKLHRPILTSFVVGDAGTPQNRAIRPFDISLQRAYVPTRQQHPGHSVPISSSTLWMRPEMPAFASSGLTTKENGGTTLDGRWPKTRLAMHCVTVSWRRRNRPCAVDIPLGPRKGSERVGHQTTSHEHVKKVGSKERTTRKMLWCMRKQPHLTR